IICFERFRVGAVAEIRVVEINLSPFLRNQPTLIADRVDAKIAAKGTPHPNGNMADAHAEIGVIQKAFNEGKTVGSDMTMNVVGKDVCGYCRGDIAAAASKSGLKSLTIQAKYDITGLPKTYYWEVGMKSIREKKI
ncbi:cytidine deaminase-like fold-containing protein, partial [Pseudomonas aeruginosa]|uniref:cytidine deaminase-like fold-containing protein n=4 Tax=Pseudomonas aeruginosa TaxID=287 RepID=UPI001E531B12